MLLSGEKGTLIATPPPPAHQSKQSGAEDYFGVGNLLHFAGHVGAKIKLF